MQIIKKYWIGLVAAVLLAGAGLLIYQTLHPKTLPENLVEGTGRIDGDLINLNTKYPCRLESMQGDDGVVVHKGMVVAVLSSKEQEAQKAQVEAQIEAEKKVLSAKQIKAQIDEETIPLRIEKAKAKLVSAQAQLDALQKNIRLQEDVLAQAKRDHKRSQFLFKSKSIDVHSFELSSLKVSTEEDRLAALKAQADEAKAAIKLAQTGVEEAQYSQKELLSIQDDIAGLKEQVKALEASKAQIEAVISEMTLRSPVEGHTVEKIANEGEVIGAGMPVATLIDPHSLYLKIFVDTLENGKIKLGDKAVIFLDAYPDRPIEARVVSISQQAEFTPKEVSVRSDRIQRVYAVHLKPSKVNPLLKLGIPAVGVISINGKGLPASLKEIPVL